MKLTTAIQPMEAAPPIAAIAGWRKMAHQSHLLYVGQSKGFCDGERRTLSILKRWGSRHRILVALNRGIRSRTMGIARCYLTR